MTTSLTPPRKYAAPAIKQTKLLIGGEWCDAADGRTFATYNPVNEEKITDVALAGKADVDRAVAAA